MRKIYVILLPLLIVGLMVATVKVEADIERDINFQVSQIAAMTFELDTATFPLIEILSTDTDVKQRIFNASVSYEGGGWIYVHVSGFGAPVGSEWEQFIAANPASAEIVPGAGDFFSASPAYISYTDPASHAAPDSEIAKIQCPTSGTQTQEYAFNLPSVDWLAMGFSPGTFSGNLNFLAVLI